MRNNLIRRRYLWQSTVFLVWQLLFFSVGTAQPKEYKPVKDLGHFKTEFAKHSAKIETIASDFQQEKQLLALTESITSTGKFWFKRKDKVRIDYMQPFTYRMIMNGDKILIRDEAKENRVNLKSNKLFQQVNRIMLDCIQGTIISSSDFTSKVFENNENYLVELSPTGKGIRDFFETILLVVDKKDYSVSIIEMREPGGDKTVMSFKNKILNQSMKDEVFAL